MSTNDHTVLKLTEELVRKAQTDRFELVIKPDSLFHMVGLMQLALRHPALAPSSRALAGTFIAGAREYFADCPTVLEVIERGFDPAEDRPWPKEVHHEQCPWHSADPHRRRSVCGCPEGWPK